MTREAATPLPEPRRKRNPLDYKEGRGDYYLAEGKREKDAAMTPPPEPRTTEDAMVALLDLLPGSLGTDRAINRALDEVVAYARAEAAGTPLRDALFDILRWTKPGSLYADGTNAFSTKGPESVARIHNRIREALGDKPLPVAALTARAAAAEPVVRRDCCSYNKPHVGDAPLGTHWVRAAATEDTDA